MTLVRPDNFTYSSSGQPNRSATLPYNPGPAAITAEANYFQASFPLKFTLIGASTVTPNNAVTPAGSEAEFQVFGRLYHSVQVAGTFNATIVVEATNDGQNWQQIDSITAPAIKQYVGPYYSMRVRISAYTSGNPVVIAITQR
jgi:hypothetical protein